MERPRVIARVRQGRSGKLDSDLYESMRISWFDDWDFAVAMRYAKYCGFISGRNYMNDLIDGIKEESNSEGYTRGFCDGFSEGCDDNSYS